MQVTVVVPTEPVPCLPCNDVTSLDLDFRWFLLHRFERGFSPINNFEGHPYGMLANLFYLPFMRY